MGMDNERPWRLIAALLSVLKPFNDQRGLKVFTLYLNEDRSQRHITFMVCGL